MRTQLYILSKVPFSVLGGRGFTFLYKNKPEKPPQQLPLQITFWDSKTVGLAEIFFDIHNGDTKKWFFLIWLQLSCAKNIPEH